MKKYSIDNPMAPLWIKYPHIPRESIGWSIGYGENYKVDFSNWYEKLSENDKLKYQEMFPSPKTWGNYYSEFIEDDKYLEEFNEHHYKNVFFWRKDGKPKYSKDELIATEEVTKEFIFFWNPEDTPQACLSQWTISNFEDLTQKYNCCEQYMMAQKALFFSDFENEKRILQSNDPSEMKRLGRIVKNFNSEEWNKVKYSIVLNGNYYKFSQNKEMRDFLMATGKSVLVEASPEDKVWGVGLDESNKDIYDLNKWKGENLLGFALMELRDELNKVYKNFNKLI